jgi:hypothetical protein
MLEKPLIPDFDETYEIINFEKELNDSNNKNLIRAQKNYEKSIQTEVNQETSDLALLEAKRRFAVFLECKDVRILALTQKEFYKCVHNTQKNAASNLNSKGVDDTLSDSELVFAIIVQTFLIIVLYYLLHLLQINGIFNILNIIILIFLITVGIFLSLSICALFESPVKATAAPNEQDLLVAEIAKLLEQKYQF